MLIGSSIRANIGRDFDHSNLLELWEDIYSEYYNYGTGARLMVRLEDLVGAGGNFEFDPRIIMQNPFWYYSCQKKNKKIS